MYYNRSLFSASKDHPDLAAWLEERYVDQKAEDARMLLKIIAASPYKGRRTLDNINYTLFIKRLYRQMMSEPFETIYDWLPDIEKQLAGLGDKDVAMLRHLAQLMQTESELYEVMPELNGDLDDSALPISLEDIRHSYLAHMDLFNEPLSSMQTNIVGRVTNLLGLVGLFLEKKQMQFAQKYAQEFTNKYREEKGLLTPESIMQWIKKMDLDEGEMFQKFLTTVAILHFITDNSSIDWLDIPIRMDLTSWLARAYSSVQ